MIQVIEIMREVAQRTSDEYLKKYAKPNAAPVKFFADNYSMVGDTLNKMGQSAKMQREKYPAIFLFNDQMNPVDAPPLKQWKVEASLHVLIVADMVEGNADRKRERLYYPVLDPICECLKSALTHHPQLFTSGNYAPKMNPHHRYNLVAILGRNRLFADKLDGIEIKNLKLYFREKNCLID